MAESPPPPMPPFSFSSSSSSSGTPAQSEPASTRQRGHKHRRSGAVSIDLTSYSLTPSLNRPTTPASAAPHLEGDRESFVVDLDDALIPSRVSNPFQDGGDRRGRARAKRGTEMEVFQEEDENEDDGEKAHGLGIDVQSRERIELRAGSDASFRSDDVNSFPDTTSVVEPHSPDFPHSGEASPVEIIDVYGGQPSYITGSTNRFTNEIDGSKRHQSIETNPYILPHRPFLTPETPTDTTFSTPKFDSPDDTNLARRNVDDVPSLISSRSTMTSAVHAPIPTLPPPTSGHAAITASSSRNTSVAPEQHSKRSSIASLSKLMRGGGGDQGRLASEGGSRSQTSEAPMSGKEKKKSGVKGLLARVFKKREARRSMLPNTLTETEE